MRRLVPAQKQGLVTGAAGNGPVAGITIFNAFIMLAPGASIQLAERCALG